MVLAGLGESVQKVGVSGSQAGEKRAVTIGMRSFGRGSVWEGG